MGLTRKKHVLDNQCSEEFKEAIRVNEMTYEAPAPDIGQLTSRTPRNRPAIWTAQNCNSPIVSGAKRDHLQRVPVADEAEADPVSARRGGISDRVNMAGSSEVW